MHAKFWCRSLSLNVHLESQEENEIVAVETLRHVA